jgi:hypothetical protein
VTIKILRKELGMVVHTCNPCTWELRQEDLEFEASLDYTASLRLAWTCETLPQTKKKKKKKRKKEKKILRKTPQSLEMCRIRFCVYFSTVASVQTTWWTGICF